MLTFICIISKQLGVLIQKTITNNQKKEQTVYMPTIGKIFDENHKSFNMILTINAKIGVMMNFQKLLRMAVKIYIIVHMLMVKKKFIIQGHSRQLNVNSGRNVKRFIVHFTTMNMKNEILYLKDFFINQNQEVSIHRNFSFRDNFW